MTEQNAAKPLDDVMLAMDVVDTLRHSARLVERELDTDGQDKRLLARLKSIYGTQGIDVPDHILREGVAALREDRFEYVPTPASFSRRLAEIYVNRTKWGKPLLGFFVIFVMCFALYSAAFVWPQQRAAKQVQIELSETLPAEFERLYARVDGLTNDQAITGYAQRIRTDGFAAIQAKDIDDARIQKQKLSSFADQLALEYDLRIVSGRNQTSGIWRIPDDNPNARNYYLLVEPVHNKKAIAINVVNEENNKEASVKKFGVRVTEDTFQRVVTDKHDDGIIQNNLIGTKSRGVLEINYNLPVLDGVITEW